ncbi:MAG TPA: GH1 family beta-glucosidase [Xanthobacteraceae bacterium]|nr:GH1 family beta-glucosidase [Xanthobacteraceae bacterium]
MGTLASGSALRAESAAEERAAFPAGFIWGASTSSYQIEGAVDVDGRGKSIWDVFCHTPGRIKNGDTGDIACDHYHRWQEDVALLASGDFSAYRFSVAWPRILPAGSGAIEQRGLDFYDRLVDVLIARGITPWLCLYHWDLPQALQERGGWLNRDTCQRFAEYAQVVSKRLADRVKHWATFNEPNVHALFGHGIGNHAPGMTGLPNMLAAVHHQNLAHGRAVAALRAERSDLRVGTVINQQPARPCSDAQEDRRAAERFDAMWNGACLDPLLKGQYPPAIASDFTPLVADGDLAAIAVPIDFLGVNYYAPMYIAHAPVSLFGAWFGPTPGGTHFTDIGWPIDPGALTEELLRLRERYGDLEFYITENGACFDDTLAADGTVQDDKRTAYLRDHLAAARRAIEAGVKLRGYFVWSLLDNFEWAEGYTKRFGVVRVDFSTQKRTPKASFSYLAEVMRRT